MNEEKAVDELTGPERAAIMLLVLGEVQAAEILKMMDARDVQKVGAAMAAIKNVSNQQAAVVVERFLQNYENQSSIGVGVPDYIKNVFTQALGEDRAMGLIDQVLAEEQHKELESLAWMDTDAITEMIRDEHPQIIAITLAHLEESQAASVLAKLPEALQHDIMMRIARLETIPSSALEELEGILKKQISGAGAQKKTLVNGPLTAANIINNSDGEREKALLDAITRQDEELGVQIQDLMFVFENLASIDDKSMQAIMREISTDTLTVALKGTDEAVKEKVFKNMSKRAREMLEEDMDARGPVKISDVDMAQKEILVVVRRLSEEGQISLGGKGEEYVS